MKEAILKVLGAEPKEGSRVFLLLAMGFSMGIFLATFSVGSFTLFIDFFDEEKDLPYAIVASGFLGIFATAVYSYLQGKIKFSSLAIGTLVLMILITAGVRFSFYYFEGDNFLNFIPFFKDNNPVYFISFMFILPITFISLLIFWGTFGRVFTMRQSKRIIGGIDSGQLIASIVALFSIPLMVRFLSVENLILLSLVAAVIFLTLFIVISSNFPFLEGQESGGKSGPKTLPYGALFKRKYLVLMSMFVIVSIIAVDFLDYSFANVVAAKYEGAALAEFIGLFEGTVVVFSFLFQTFVTDRLIEVYGLRFSLSINPILISILTVATIIVGYTLGYESTEAYFIYFFLMIALCRLFLDSLKGALDEPAFKLYFLPLGATLRFDAQTKIEGVVSAFASVIAGSLIILLSQIGQFSLIYIPIAMLPFLAIWYFLINRMHEKYRETLQDTLVDQKQSAGKDNKKEYGIDKILENEVNSDAEEKIIYGLKIMERIEPALFESSVLKLKDSPHKGVKTFAIEKIKQLDMVGGKGNEIRHLAARALGESEANEVLSIPHEKLAKIAKSIKRDDKILAARLLRKLMDDNNIFILLELLRDADSEVKMEAVITARITGRRETWPVLIEMLNSDFYGHAASAALKAAGEKVLPTLENAFHKSGQSEKVMLKIIQIMGRIGSKEAIELMWKKVDYPNQRIVNQILLTFRYFNIQVTGNKIPVINNLLEAEISQAIWNMAAILELPEKDHFLYLKEALNEEVIQNHENIFMLMSILYDPQSVQLVRENIEIGSSDSIAFAMELLDLFLTKELKPKLFPLLDDMAVPDKVKKLQFHFPRESHTPMEALDHILNRDFNQNNRYTKACAIHAMAFIEDIEITHSILAHLFNPDPLLKETTAWLIYHRRPELFNKVADRIASRDKKWIEESIKRNRLVSGLEDGFYLKIEVVLILRKINIFNSLSGLLLCDIADRLQVFHLDAGEDLSIMEDEDGQQPMVILAEGQAEIISKDQKNIEIKNFEVFSDFFLQDEVFKSETLKAKTRTVVFQLNMIDFYNILADHHDLAQEFINNITAKVTETPELN